MYSIDSLFYSNGEFKETDEDKCKQEESTSSAFNAAKETIFGLGSPR